MSYSNVLEQFLKTVPTGTANKKLNFCQKTLKESSNKTDILDEVSKIINSTDENLIIKFLAGIIHKCPVCGKYFYRRGVKTCSQECSKIEHLRTFKQTCIQKYGTDNPLKAKEVRQKVKETNLKKYGVENISQAKEIKEKVQQTNFIKYGAKNYTQSDDFKIKNRETCLKRYGVENVFQSQETKDKIEQTNLAKYGVKHNTQNKDIQDKVHQTFLKRYGSSNYFLSSDFKVKSTKTNLAKYGVLNPMYSQEIRDKIKSTNLARYGVENYTQTKEYLIKTHKTCLQKYGNEVYQRTNDFKNKSIQTNIKKFGSHNFMLSDARKQKNIEELLNDYKALNAEHLEKINKNFIQKTFIININNIDYFNIEECKKYFHVSYVNCLRIKRCFDIKEPNYVENSGRSNAEIELFKWIPCNNKISNDRKIIYPLELDMLLPDYRLAIEYDGVYWHSDEYKPKNYHLNKTIACNNKEIQLFHIFESDDIDIWKSMICNKLNLSNKIYARKCIVQEITNKDAKSFCVQNHLQGVCNSKINLGLFYDNELLEVMTFGKPRFTQKYQYELLRLCTKKYYSVIGGASKLWKYFLTKYSPKSVLSYANRRFSNGSIYETLGFKFINKTKPNYFYVHSSSFVKVSRISAQKHKLKTFLKKYDANLSERENMSNNGYLQIFDCGNLVYEFIA